MKAKKSQHFVKKQDILKETFGIFKFKKPIEKMIKEMDKKLYNKCK